MLSPEEHQEIVAEFARYPQKQAVCIEAMRIVQRHRGWVSDESIQDVAQLLEMSPSDLDSVATFYNLIYREPVGRHIIQLCNSVSCWVMGYERLREQLSQELGVQFGQTTTDGRFTLLPAVCLGDCDHAPVLMIDGDLHRGLSPDLVKSILENYR